MIVYDYHNHDVDESCNDCHEADDNVDGGYVVCLFFVVLVFVFPTILESFQHPSMSVRSIR